MQRQKLVKWLLILALAFVFGEFGIDKFVHPIIWISWIPSWMNGFAGLSSNSWLQIMGAFEILFAVMILIPVNAIRKAGVILIILYMIAVLTQVGWNDVAVRDIGLMISAIALLAAL